MIVARKLLLCFLLVGAISGFAKISPDSLHGIYIGATQSHVDANPWTYRIDTIYIDSILLTITTPSPVTELIIFSFREIKILKLPITFVQEIRLTRL